MLEVHELRVELRGDEIHTLFYQKTRAGKRLVGHCVAKRHDKSAVKAAIEAEFGFVLEGQGSQRM